MAITKQQKATQLADLTDKMKKAESVIFSQYSGLTVTEIGEMRQKVREANAEMKVAKKTLMRLAAKAAGLPDVSREAMEGPIACIFSFTDPLSGAQAAFKFAKDHDLSLNDVTIRVVNLSLTPSGAEDSIKLQILGSAFTDEVGRFTLGHDFNYDAEGPRRTYNRRDFPSIPFNFRQYGLV